MILEPDLDLLRCEIEQRCEVFPFRGREISLLPEPSFQLIGLGLGEKDAAFLLLDRLLQVHPVAVLVQVVVVIVVHLDVIIALFERWCQISVNREICVNGHFQSIELEVVMSQFLPI